MNLIGSSFDIHRLEEGTYVILGGIKIPCAYKAIARSDGDVVLHALSEAIFAALGMDDLGTYFPESSPATDKMDSKKILEFAINSMIKRNLSIQNINVHILLQEPRLENFKQMIKSSLSNLLSIKPTFVSVHAGTLESLGSIGEKKAIACFSTVLLTDNK